MSPRRLHAMTQRIAELEYSAERARDAGNVRQAERYMRRASRLWARVKGGN